jgi:predicted homoserine dehydrogenase-like protein
VSLVHRLRQRERQHGPIRVAVTGAGFMARGLLRQLELAPGMAPVLVVARRPAAAARTWADTGAGAVVVAKGAAEARAAIESGTRVVCPELDVLPELGLIDVLVEATGAVAYGASAALAAIEAGAHVVMLNAETDATVGGALKLRADAAGVVYGGADGDQPGVLRRMVDEVELMGMEVVAAVNCKGFMDAHATPESVAPWADRQGTSRAMTTAFADGTKMNIENAVLANATGLRPEVRGMHGVRTTLAEALRDCLAAFRGSGLVDYTLGGDFGGGVFVVARGEPAVQPYMAYLKMGPGPEYLFFRPHHLCHLETPRSVAETVLDRAPTIAPLGAPVAEVITVAKRDLRPGERLDGMGGRTAYGQIDVAQRTGGLVPIGLCEGATVTRPLRRDEPIPLESVELAHDPVLAPLRRAQEALAAQARSAA